MKKITKKNIILLSMISTLYGCSAVASGGYETAFKYLGIAKGITDAGSYSLTGKTTNDHILSAALGKDCKLSRIIAKKSICIEFDSASYKYNVFHKGKILSKNNVVDIQFPSEIYDFDKTLEKDLKKKLKQSTFKQLFK